MQGQLVLSVTYTAYNDAKCKCCFISGILFCVFFFECISVFAGKSIVFAVGLGL